VELTVATYVDYLAAGVPPRRLLASAARKVWRAARTRVAAAPATPGREELLRGMGVRGDAILAHRLATPGRGLLAPDRAGITSGLASLFPGEVARTVERAARAASGRAVVFAREIVTRRPGGGTDWWADPLHGGGFTEGDAASRLDGAPPADIKVPWAVGRGDQWVALGCGALAEPARADEFAHAFADSLHDFVEQNPPGRGVQWASPMEAALRAVCLGQAHAMLTGRPALARGQYALDLAGLAVATGRYVLCRLEDAHVVPNNHLAAGWLGLLACSVLVPEWPEAPRWRRLGVTGLVRELAAQTHDDGTSFEGSLPYHRLALEIFTAGALLTRLARAPLPGAFWKRLAGMCAAARSLLASSGEIPQIGDDDSGRVFAFRQRAALDGAYLLPLGAAVLGDPGLRVRGGIQGAEEALWLCGRPAVEALGSAPPGPPPASASFPRGGFHVLRRGSIEAVISCGRNGQGGIGGHSHNDKLSFELRLAGRLVVCDPGSPSYTGDPALRDRFRATRAHATVVVDGEEQAPIPADRPFALPDAARATLLAFESSAGRERFLGEHRGYARLGAVHRREIALVEGALRIRDRLEGAGAHVVEVRFPFPTAEARLRRPAADERRRLEALGVLTPSTSAHAVEYGPPQAPLALLVVVVDDLALEGRLEDATYSPGYAELARACTAVFAARVTCPALLTSFILPLVTAPLAFREPSRDA
jgi:Heparinase II/III-like protein/Heparinase II/III N-terminus